jgi:protein phosphatase
MTNNRAAAVTHSDKQHGYEPFKMEPEQPMISSLLNIEMSSWSDVGQLRKINEDSFCVDEALGLMLVADGMGGHEAGEVASSIASTTFRQELHQCIQDCQNYVSDVIGDAEGDKTWLDLPNPLLALIELAATQANRQVLKSNLDEGYKPRQRMGTTLVGVWMQPQLRESVVFNIGDSRLYIWRNDKLTALTKDHSLHQQWLDFGKVGPEPSKKIILNAVGITDKLKMDLRIHGLKKGDIMLACSDGLSGMLSDKKISALLKRYHSGENTLDEVSKLLVNQANANGGDDNITVTLAACR